MVSFYSIVLLYFNGSLGINSVKAEYHTPLLRTSRSCQEDKLPDHNLCAHPGIQDLSAHISTYIILSLIFSPHFLSKGSAMSGDIDAGQSHDMRVRLGVTLWPQTSIDLASVRLWTD